MHFRRESGVYFVCASPRVLRSGGETTLSDVFLGTLRSVLFGARAARFSPPIDNGKTDGVEQEGKCQNNEIDRLVQGNGKSNDRGRHHPYKNLAQHTIRPVRNTSRRRQLRTNRRQQPRNRRTVGAVAITL